MPGRATGKRRDTIAFTVVVTVLVVLGAAGMLLVLALSGAPGTMLVATVLATLPLRRLGLPIPPEMLSQLRFGRGLDNRRLKATGFEFAYTTREAVLKLAEHQRVRGIQDVRQEPYRYEREVEEFLRYSPSVRREGTVAGVLDARDAP